MAGNENKSAELHYSFQQENFRLLELPSQLADMITEPSRQSLLLKSAALPSAAASPNSRNFNAVLCTSDKTYQFRQVQTSNTVFVTQISGEPGLTLDNDTTLSTISTCDSVLELVPSNEDSTSYLRDLLRMYDGTVRIERTDSDHPRTKKDIIADIPLSDVECQNAWTAMNAFELGENCYLPSSRILLQLWHSLLPIATAEEIDLTKEFHAEDLWTHVDQELYPRPLLAGLLDQICSPSQNVSWDSSRFLEKTTFIEWIQDLVIQHTLDTSSILAPEFVKVQVQDNIPERWREVVSVQSIQNVINRKRRKLSDDSDIKNKPSKQSGASNARKWHEKLQRSRK